MGGVGGGGQGKLQRENALDGMAMSEVGEMKETEGEKKEKGKAYESERGRVYMGKRERKVL